MDRWRPGDAFPPDGKAAGVKKGSVVLIPPAPDDPPKPLTDPKPEHCRTVYIGFLPRETNENHVYDAFNSCGRIEDIRLNTVKCFCHLQFYRSTAVDRALMYRGWWFKIGPSNTSNHVSKVVINYATSRPKEYLPFNHGILTTVSNQLKDKLQFDRASQQVKRWIEAGNCTPELSASFFALLSSINGRAKQVMEGADKYEESMLAMMKEAHEGTIESCEPTLQHHTTVSLCGMRACIGATPHMHTLAGSTHPRTHATGAYSYCSVILTLVSAHAEWCSFCR